MDSLLLFHGPACPDGFGAAWAAFQALGTEADYKPINYGDPVPDVSGYQEVFIVDFSFREVTLRELASKVKKLVVLDHYKTAKTELDGLEIENATIKFDMNKSGAVLAWEYFHPEHKVPLLLEYVQDRDLWTWLLPGSREISAALDLVPREFSEWSKFGSKLEYPAGFDKLMFGGTAVRAYIQKKVDGLAAKAEMKTVGGFLMPTVNSSILQSEIGEKLNQLYESCYYSGTYFIKGNSQIWSIRSKKKDADCGQLCKSYGGGGHPGAAGFTLEGKENWI